MYKNGLIIVEVVLIFKTNIIAQILDRPSSIPPILTRYHQEFLATLHTKAHINSNIFNLYFLGVTDITSIITAIIFKCIVLVRKSRLQLEYMAQ